MAHNYKQRMIETKRKSKNSKTVRNITKLRMRLDEMKGTTQNYSKHYMLQRKQAHNSIQCFVIKSREINNTERRNSSMTLIHPELLSVLILWFILQHIRTNPVKDFIEKQKKKNRNWSFAKTILLLNRIKISQIKINRKIIKLTDAGRDRSMGLKSGREWRKEVFVRVSLEIERRERARGVGLCCWGRKRDENRKFNSNVFVYFFS